MVEIVAADGCEKGSRMWVCVGEGGAGGDV